MTDPERPGAEQPELLPLAEILYQHAEALRRAEFDRWYADHPAGWLCAYTHQGKALQGWEAGWRAALGWYVAIVTRPPLAEQAADQLAASSAEALGHAADCWAVPRCGELIVACGHPRCEAELYCHRRKGHQGAHHLGH